VDTLTRSTTLRKRARAPKAEPEQPARQPLARWKRWLFAFVGFVLLPLLLLALVELSLRLAGYGYSTAFFKRVRIQGADCFVENDKFGLRFFPPALARSPPPMVMKAAKGPNTCRVFVVGGVRRSAAGIWSRPIS